jgi:outer membrane protein assembly factor BamB/tRNA A-37 threonylcarbamoyl transferase component Bud32
MTANAESGATGAYQPDESASELVRVLDQYVADLQAGRAAERDQLLAAHPALAAQLEQCLAGIEFIHRATQPTPETPAQLGDFRIIREVGRGGMGVVYEAEQLSLKRKVALKVLRFGAVADAEVMQRFQREAETVARLHHTNIVPVFAVGNEHGVHYYAMQFIEGKSLAAVLEESQAQAAPLEPREVARWGLQAAEALAHAHQRGIIHRDIKPSNLLLDPEGVLWLTDFGLARRVDEVVLTATGVLIGTPRYMSPEQAAVVKQPVDHRTDIYSLGATLYELATGKPVFDADTPEGILSQIQNTEPVVPRQVRRDLPRDLETIILKCLAKEPARRYATARDLAEDLRSFLLGRAIKARRPSLAERAVRWARKQRSSAVLAAGTAAASVLLVIGAYLAWQWYAAWRLGQVVLTTGGAGLEAEILDENDEPVLPPFPVSATPRPVALPAGMYRVRVSAPGPVSELYHLLVEQGTVKRFEIRLGDRLLWPPLEVTKGFEVIDLDGRSDVIVVTEAGLRRMNGATGREVWQRSLKKADQPAVSASKGYEWPLGKAWYGPPSIDPPYGVRPWLVRPAPDLDGDGTPCLVWACRPSVWAHPWLLAVSARDGMVKWWYESRHLTREEDYRNSDAGVVCPPLVEDVDGDGKPDLIATFGWVYHEGAPPWVEAISGRTGRLIWRYTFDRDVKAPHGKNDNWLDTHYVTLVTREGGRRILVVVAGRCLVGLDLQTGKEVWSVRELDFEPLATPVIRDVTGDGRPALLLLKSKDPIRGDLTLVALAPDGRPLWEHLVGATSLSRSRVPELEWPLVTDLDGKGKPVVIVPYHNAHVGKNGWVGLEVLDGATGQSHWRSRLSQGYRGAAEYCPVAHFVVGPDLDGDGCRDIFTAALIDEPASDQPRRLTRRLVVAANSGADGRLLWRKLLPVDQDLYHVGPLRWASAGADGRHHLAVSMIGAQVDWLRKETKGTVAQTLLFASATGKLEHRWRGVSHMDTADFNGDGIPDLYGLRLETEQSGKLYALRGDLPETRRLGTWQPAITGRPHEDGQTLHVMPPLPHGDLDGDGIPDTIVFHPRHWADTDQPPALYACSGKDGRRLWQVNALPGMASPNKLASKCYWLECRDLDGNGRPQVLVTYRLGQEGGSDNEGWLAVLSGRTGKVLWTKQLGGFAVLSEYGGRTETFHNASQRPLLMDRRGDGVPYCLVTVQTGEHRQELHAIDARNGRVCWKQALEPYSTVSTLIPIREGLNGNSSGDLLVTSVFPWVYPPLTPAGPSEVVNRTQIARWDGRTGHPQWTWLGPEGKAYHSRPLLADLDGDGRHSVEMVIGDEERHRYQLLILDPQGQPRQTPDIQPPLSSNGQLRLWSHDLDNDGKEDLLVFSADKLQALHTAHGAGRAALTLLWEWRVPDGSGDLVGIRPASSDHGAVVVVRSAKGLHGLDGPTGKRLWEAPLPAGVRAVFGWDPGIPSIVWRHREDSRHGKADLEFQPANAPVPGDRAAMSVIVVMHSDDRIEGLDPSAGQVRWRCEGPGRVAGLSAGDSPGDLPSVWFHTSQPTGTVYRQALAVAPNGQYGQPMPAALDYGPAPDDPWIAVPLPWVTPACQRLTQAVLPGLTCLGLLAFFALRRKRRIVLGLLFCAVAVPIVVGAFEIRSGENWIETEQHHVWGGWYWLWIYTLSEPGEVPLSVICGYPLLLAVVVFLPGRWRLVAIGVLIFFPLLLFFFGAHGPEEVRPWLWEFRIRLPAGYSLRSPLVWMLGWVMWEARRACRDKGLYLLNYSPWKGVNPRVPRARG